MRTPLFFLLILSGVATAGLPAQDFGPPQPGATFTAAINFVEVPAIVTDRDGAFVRDLTRDDFEVFEDGKPQKLALFSLVDVPIERPITPAGAAAPVEWDVRAATRRFDGRIYVLVLDDLHTAFSRSQLVRDVARKFVEQYLGATDLAAIVHTSGRQDAGQELTGSRRLLLAAIERFQGRKLPSAGAEKLARHLRDQGALAAAEAQPLRTSEGLQRAESVRDPNDAERGLNARRAIDTVRNSADWLTDVPGRRKALLLFSEGFDYDIYQPFNRGAGDSLLLDVRQAVAAAQRANVHVYGIDPRGLNQFAGLLDIGAQSDYPQLEYGSFRGALRELLLAQESLISLAEQTGGLAIVDAGDVPGGLGRIVLDSSRYYLLGYYSDAANRSDRFLKIDVRVKRPGLDVRARMGYLPRELRVARAKPRARANAAPALAAALSKPLPIGELPLRVVAAPFKGSGRNASVLVALEIDGPGLQFVEREGRFNSALEVSIVATDQRARVQDEDRQTFNLRLLPETHERIRRTGVRFLSRLALPAGRYQIRVGAHEAGSGVTAMVPYDLEVPDYSKLPFGLSGLLVTSSEAASFATAGPDPQSAAVLAGPPLARRTFSAAETLICFAEVYDRLSPAAREIAFVLTVRDASDGRTVFAVRDRRAIQGSEQAAAHGFRVAVPLMDLKAGVYVARVEATSSAGGHHATHDVPFEVTSVAAFRSRP